MANPGTITLDGSTIVSPSSLQPFAQTAMSKIVPIDGGTIVQISANVDSTGDKNGIRKMTWDGLPFSDSRWTHTIGTIKALEGKSTTVNMGSLWGAVYTITTSILIHEVNIEDLGYDFLSGKQIYKVEINYTHV